MVVPVAFLLLCGAAGIGSLSTVQRRPALGAFLLGLSLAWFAAIWVALILPKIFLA